MKFQGILHFELGNAEEAIESLNLSFLYLKSLTQDWAEAKYTLALLYINQINTEASIQCLLESLQVFNLKQSPYKWADIQILLSRVILQRKTSKQNLLVSFALF